MRWDIYQAGYSGHEMQRVDYWNRTVPGDQDFGKLTAKRLTLLNSLSIWPDVLFYCAVAVEISKDRRTERSEWHAADTDYTSSHLKSCFEDSCKIVQGLK